MQLSVFVALAFATLAVATPTRRNSPPASPGNVCCESVTTASDPAAAAILKSIGVDAGDVNALVGLTCTDVTVIGGSATCGSTQTEVSCQDNSHAELISISCVPVTVSKRNDSPPPSPGNVCCQELTTASDPTAAAILGSIGVVVQDVNALVGLTCTDVTVIGDSATCGSDTTEVTCQDNSHAELISVSCVPVTVSKRNDQPAPSSPGDVCCDQVVSATDPAATTILALLGIVVQDVNALVGLTCTDVTVIGNSATCGSSQTSVSCTDNSHAELISIGCVPITL